MQPFLRDGVGLGDIGGPRGFDGINVKHDNALDLENFEWKMGGGWNREDTKKLD